MRVTVQRAQQGQQATFRRYAAHTTVVTIGGERFRLTAAQGADGALAELAIGWGSHWGDGLLRGYAAALCAGLDRGIPLAALLRTGLGLRFTPDGSTDDPEIPFAFSVVDYCCRRLAIDWLPAAERAALGVVTPAELGRARSGYARDRARMVAATSRLLPAGCRNHPVRQPGAAGEQRAQPLPVPGVESRRVGGDGVHDGGAVRDAYDRERAR